MIGAIMACALAIGASLVATQPAAADTTTTDYPDYRVSWDENGKAYDGWLFYCPTIRIDPRPADDEIALSTTLESVDSTGATQHRTASGEPLTACIRPTASGAMTYTWTITFADKTTASHREVTGSHTFTKVMQGPVIHWVYPSSAGDFSAPVGQSVTPHIECTDDVLPIRSCYVSPETITPTTAGTYDFTAIAANNNGVPLSERATLHAYDDGSSPDIPQPEQPLALTAKPQTQIYPSTDWTDVEPSTRVVAGNPVRIHVQAHNPDSRPITAKLQLVDQSSTPLPGDQPDITVPAGGDWVQDLPWDSTDAAWDTHGKPVTDTIALAARAIQKNAAPISWTSVSIQPRPLVLVHGYKSNANSSWGAYQTILAKGHPLLHGWAVGDGQVPGKLNTGTSDDLLQPTNTIAENASQESSYIEGVRNKTGAWHVDVLAHSMGGLMSRYYIQELMPADPEPGKPVVHRLIQMGTPNRGSPLADILMSIGAADKHAIPLFPATMQLSTAYVDHIFNGFITNLRGVPISNLVGTEIPLLAMPVKTAYFGDGIVPASSAKWDLTDAPESPRDFHTAMTESEEDFQNYVLPRLIGHPITTAAPRQLASAEPTPSNTDTPTPSDTDTPVPTPTDSGTPTPAPTGTPADGCDPTIPVDWGGCPGNPGDGNNGAPSDDELTDPVTIATPTVTVDESGSGDATVPVPDAAEFGAVAAAQGATLSLIDPDGDMLSQTTQGSGTFGFADAFSPRPVAGNWTVHIDGAKPGSAVSVAVWVSGGPYSLSVDAPTLSNGRTLLTAAPRGKTDQLTADRPAVRSVVARVGDVDGAVKEVALHDDGKDGDATLGDGTYSGLSPALDPGTEHPVTITADVSGSQVIASTTVVGSNVQYRLAATADEGGTVAATPQRNTYAAGEIVTVEATAREGWQQTGWTIDGHDASPGTLSMTMDRDHTVTARFGPEPHTPVVTVQQPKPISEGGTASITAGFSDPDGGPWTASYSIDGGPALPARVDGTTASADVAFAQDGHHDVTVNIIDATGRVGSATTVATVNNADPVPALTGITSRTVTTGTPVTLTGSFTDAGTQDTHRATFTLVSGSASVDVPATVQESRGSGTATGTVTLTQTGTWTVQLAVADDAGAKALAPSPGGAPFTVTVTAPPPPTTPRERVLADFDATVAKLHVTSAAAAPLRSLLDQAAVLAATGKRADRLGAQARLVAYTAAVLVDTLLGKTSANQAAALIAVGGRAASVLSLN
ncbi:InlB B-repeat-containing protein [Leifsonia sp. 22587]|uniref:InlB B-repeat-containing protein n=1 Tax=Leifsonia sp. 22587 TaxID=3453946 RepID=UPI003F83AAF6